VSQGSAARHAQAQARPPKGRHGDKALSVAAPSFSPKNNKPPTPSNMNPTPIPELLTRIKIDLKRLFVSVIDHTTGPEHQLLFFKERFLAKDHPDRPKMDSFSAKLRKLGLREETIGYGPSKEKWEEFLISRSAEFIPMPLRTR
jgi:hypothetical protein